MGERIPLRPRCSGERVDPPHRNRRDHAHRGVQLAIRDLWSKPEFELLKEPLLVKPGDAVAEVAAKGRLCTVADVLIKRSPMPS
jgi:hypothetical protein